MSQFKWKKHFLLSTDPPWDQNDRNIIRKDGKMSKFGGGAKAHYPTMKTKDIAALPIRKLAEENSMLFMWATLPKLPDAFTVMKAWGFKYSTVGFVWIKLDIKHEKNKNKILSLAKELQSATDLNEILIKMFELTTFFGVGNFTASNCEVCLIGRTGKTIPKKKKVSQIIISPREKIHSKKPDIFRDRIIEMYGDISRVEFFARPYPNNQDWDLIGNEIDGRDIRDVLKEY